MVKGYRVSAAINPCALHKGVKKPAFDAVLPRGPEPVHLLLFMVGNIDKISAQIIGGHRGAIIGLPCVWENRYRLKV